MAVTTYGTSLEWGVTETSTSKKIDIKSFPDLGGAPTLHDVSTFLSKIKVTIPGRQEMDGLEFDYFLDADSANYESVLTDSNTKLFYKLKFGNNGEVATFAWEGQHQTWIVGTDGDAPIECKLLVAPSTGIEKV